MTPRQLNTRSRSAYTVREAAPRSAEGSVPTRDNAAESLGQEGVRCAANQNQNKKKGKSKMKSSVYKSYDELPLFLNSDLVAKTLGIAPSSAYELMHEKDFPTLHINCRMVVPKEKFIQWVEEHTKGGERA